MAEEYTIGIVIPPGINSYGQEESTGRMVIPSRITSSGIKKNPPEEWDSAGNYKLMDGGFIRGLGFL
jgi:hypothetical protein